CRGSAPHTRCRDSPCFRRRVGHPDSGSRNWRARPARRFSPVERVPPGPCGCPECACSRGDSMIDVQLRLNDVDRNLVCAPGETLLSVLRREGCFSVRFGSETGETGAAAVLLDGKLVSADVLLAAQAGGHDVTTVEGLNVATGEFHPIQQAFVET